MKKKAALILSLIVVFSFTMLAACGGGGAGGEDLSDSKYVGTWRADSMSLGEESDEISDEYILVVNGDGTGHLDGSGEVSEFTWKPGDDGFKTKGDVKMTFKDEDGGIYGKILGVELHFVKQD